MRVQSRLSRSGRRCRLTRSGLPLMSLCRGLPRVQPRQQLAQRVPHTSGRAANGSSCAASARASCSSCSDATSPRRGNKPGALVHAVLHRYGSRHSLPARANSS